MTRARCGIGCEYTVYSGYLPWSFISLLPCSILSSRNPSPARFLPPAAHASPRSFLACSHHQPSLPQPSLPPLTLRACVASLLPLSLPLLSPSLLLSLPPLVPSPTITLLPPSLPPSLLLSLPPLVPSPTITLLPPLPPPPSPPSFPPSVPPPSILPRPFPVSHHRFLPPSHPLFPPSLPPSILPCSFPVPRCLLASCRASFPRAMDHWPSGQYTLCVYTVLASCTGYCLGRASHAWRWDNGVAPSAGGSRLPWQRTPTTNPFFTNSKKIRRSKHATNTHKHGRGSYLSDGTHGDSQSHVERQPLRSKDRGLFTYNIDDRLIQTTAVEPH